MTIAAGKRKAELAAQEERLLSLYLSWALDEGTYQSNSTELRGHAKDVEDPLRRCRDIDPACRDIALAAFDFAERRGTLERFKVRPNTGDFGGHISELHTERHNSLPPKEKAVQLSR
ncbi:MAG: hypothetical protein ACE15C_16890 [Phycisphaerae bacterium]